MIGDSLICPRTLSDEIKIDLVEVILLQVLNLEFVLAEIEFDAILVFFGGLLDLESYGDTGAPRRR